MGRKAQSPLEALDKAPERFRFDAAFRLLQAAARAEDAEDPVRFSAPATLAQPMAEVSGIAPPQESLPAQLTTPMLGLIGPSGVMPRWYTELVAQSIRARARGIADFLDMLAQRLVLAFARAGEKYRLHRSSEAASRAGVKEPIGEAVLALTGYGLGNMPARLAAGPDALRYYAGYMSAYPRASSRLASMVSDYLGRQVEIIEFAGAWSSISPDQRSRLPRGRIPGVYNALSRDAAIGIRVWDQQARFILRVGPLTRAEFEALLPDQPLLAALVSLVRAYAGWEHDFAVNLLLAAPEIPPLRLAAPGVQDAPRLGWTSWLPATTARLTGRTLADDALFAATLVEHFGRGP
jgi:type VI secretion system protein ImpH